MIFEIAVLWLLSNMKIKTQICTRFNRTSIRYDFHIIMKFVQNSHARRSQWNQGAMHPPNMNSCIKKVRLLEIIWKVFHISSFSMSRFHEDTVNSKNLRSSLKPVWKANHLMKLPLIIFFIFLLNIWNGPLKVNHLNLDPSIIVLVWSI